MNRPAAPRSVLEPLHFAWRVTRRTFLELWNWNLVRTRPRQEARARARLWKGRTPAPSDAILVAQLADIGDLVVTGPFLRSLRRAFPQSRIVLAVSPLTAPLARACPHVDEVAVFDVKNLAGADWIRKSNGCAIWWEEAAALRSTHFPTPPALAFSTRSEQDPIQAAAQILLASSRAGRRVAYSLKHQAGRLRSDLLLDVIPPLDPAQGETDRYLALLRAAGIPVDDPGTPETWSTPASLAEAARLAAPFLATGKPLVAIALGAGTEEKKWSLDNLSTLAKWVEDRLGALPLLIGGPGDIATGEHVLRRGGLREAVNLAGKLPLDVTAAFLRHADLFVGSDSGPLHLAAAAGVPSVALFLSSKTARWTPRLVPLRVLEADTMAAIGPTAVQEAILDLKPEWRGPKSGRPEN